MLLIISGPQASSKSTIARQIATASGCKLYDEIPPEKPADLSHESLVIFTTNLSEYPKWIHDFIFHELFTKR